MLEDPAPPAVTADTPFPGDRLAPLKRGERELIVSAMLASGI